MSDLPSQHLDVLVNLFSREFQLFISVARDFHSQVLDGLHTSDAVDFHHRLFREDLRLLFVQSEIPSLLERHQLLNDQGQLVLVVGHYQYVVNELQEVFSLIKIFKFAQLITSQEKRRIN